MVNSARLDLVRLTQSALRYDADIKPQEFDPSDRSSVITVALSWKLDSTNRALQNSLCRIHNRENLSQGDPTPNDASQPGILQNTSEPGIEVSPLRTNPFANDATGPNAINPLELSHVLHHSNSQKRRYDGIILIPNRIRNE